MAKQRVRVPTKARWADTVGYSRAVRIGDTVYVSGTIAVQADGTIGPPDDAGGQARRCLEIIVEALAEAGARPEEVVSTKMYVTDVGRWEDVGREHGRFFGDAKPATTLVEVAALVAPEALVEIEAIAVVDSAG